MASNPQSLRQKFQKLASAKLRASTDDRPVDWEPIISIGTAARMVGLSVSALRKYEREGLLIYHRSDSGQRLLSRADLKRIQMIQHFINDVGLNMEGIRRLLALLPCWKLKPCDETERGRCPANLDPVLPCWLVEDTLCERSQENCRRCNVYRFGAYCTETIKELVHHDD